MVRSVRIALHHRDANSCPENARNMMGTDHRIGCAMGQTCPSTNPRGGASRAEYYARIESDLGADKPEVRVQYLCTTCATEFAREYQITLVHQAAR